MFGVDEFVFGAPQPEEVGQRQQEQDGHSPKGVSQPGVGLLVGQRHRHGQEQQQDGHPPFYRTHGCAYRHHDGPQGHQPQQQDARRQAPLQQLVAVIRIPREDCSRKLPYGR